MVVALLPFLVEMCFERRKMRELFSRGELLLITVAICAGALGQLVEHLLFTPGVKYPAILSLAFAFLLVIVVIVSIGYGKVAVNLQQNADSHKNLRDVSPTARIERNRLAQDIQRTEEKLESYVRWSLWAYLTGVFWSMICILLTKAT